MRDAKKLNELGIEFYWRFTEAAIETIPEAPGIIAFFDEEGRVILMGSAAKSMRALLRNHWKGYEGRLTCGATFVGFEPASSPLKREAELAELYERRYGRAPRRQTG